MATAPYHAMSKPPSFSCKAPNNKWLRPVLETACPSQAVNMLIAKRLARLINRHAWRAHTLSETAQPAPVSYAKAQDH